MNVFLYKVLKNTKHRKLGWLMSGRYVKCRPEYARSWVLKGEFFRITQSGQENIKYMWIDDLPEPKKVVEPELVEPPSKPVQEVAPKKTVKKQGRPKKNANKVNN